MQTVVIELRQRLKPLKSSMRMSGPSARLAYREAALLLRAKQFLQIADQLFYSLFREGIERRIGHAAGLIRRRSNSGLSLLPLMNAAPVL